MLRRFQCFLSTVTLTSLVFSLIVTARGGGGRNVGAINQTSPIEAVETAPEKLSAPDYGKMPLLFEENEGQTDRQAKFISRGSGYTLYLTEREAVFQLRMPDPGFRDANRKQPGKKESVKTKSDFLRMKFAGTNPHPAISGADETVTKTNYYIGKKKFENLRNYRRVDYKNLYDGIDAAFYGNGANQPEYDFVIAPNIDADKIAFNFDGAKNISVDEQGNLVAKTENTRLVQQKPVAYQTIDGARREVEVKYVIKERSDIPNPTSQISFALGQYDRSRPLTIDPALNYLTYIGGTISDGVFDIEADNQGNAYITGFTDSLDFHGERRTTNEFDGAFAAKINPQGTAFLYITVLEGDKEDFADAITLDANNNAYIAGAASKNFPITPGAFDDNPGGVQDIFAAKLNANGNLVYSTYIGGLSPFEFATGIAIDLAGKVYIVGQTQSGISFPQKNRYQGCGAGLDSNSGDGFLTVLNASGSDITYSTCIGGAFFEDQAKGVAIDSANNVYLTGYTTGGNFPTKNAFQPESGGGDDAWVAKFNPAESGEASLIYSTYLGGIGTDQGNDIAVDAADQVYITGITGSTNFPLLNAFDSTNQVNEAFVTRLTPSGGLNFSSFLGGSNTEEANGITVDNRGSVYVTGLTDSDNFPLALPFQSSRRGLQDAFVTKIRIGTGVVSSTLLGGRGKDLGTRIAVKGNFIYVAGFTDSNNLLTTSGVIKPTSNASSTNRDGFVAKILDTRPDSVGVFRPASTFTLTQSITNVVPVNANLTVNMAGAKGVSGDFNGDGIDTIGSFTDGTWKVRDVNFPLVILPPKTITFGQAGDLPVVGDWNNDRIETPGVYRPSTGQFLLTNSTSVTPTVDITVNFGIAEDLPVAGDWNSDGFDSVGVFRPSTGQFFLTDDNVAAATIDQAFFFGTAGDLPTVGDWNGDGRDTVGVWRPSTTEFFLTNDNINFSNVFTFGQVNTDQPIAGDWDGKPAL